MIVWECSSLAVAYWNFGTNSLRVMFHHSFHLLVLWVCFDQFSLNNVHRRGLNIIFDQFNNVHRRGLNIISFSFP